MSAPKMQLVDWLDDLSVRFIVNLPKEELESIERICFQVEEAQWFYEDFIRPTDPQLPTMNLKQFCLAFFQHCPLFAEYDVNMYMQAFQNFLEYKSRVPVRGAILLDDTLDEVVLVRGWKKGANWSFPRGKINKAEDDLDCAIREVFEETGLDLEAAGLIPKDRNVKSIDISLREQSIKLFVIPNVPKETYFQPQTRKEIGGIQWYKLADLPTIKKVKQHQQNQEGHGENLASHANKFYMVAPFLGPLRKQISYWRKARQTTDQHVMTQGNLNAVNPEYSMDGFPQQSTMGSLTAQNDGNGDMDRLLSQLRQSKQAFREENLPEVMQNPSQYPDATPSTAPTADWTSNQLPYYAGTQSQVIAAHERQQTNKWASMVPMDPHQGPSPGLGPASTHTIQTSQPAIPPAAEIPQTPLELINSQPQMPPSPQHHNRPHVVNSAALNRPPPPFTATPSWTQSDELEAPHAHLLSSSSHTLPSHHVATRSFAPYRQTGDPEFSVQSHAQNTSGPSVPEASKLPAPTLTANSAMLLSLFKGSKKADEEDTEAAEMSADPRSQAPSMAVNSGTNLLDAFRPSQQRVIAVPSPLSLGGERTITPALTPPTELGATSPATSRPRTSQQTALLDLFKSQPGRSLSSPSPALALGPPPTIPPAELSAAQSPAQTFSQYGERRAGSSEALAPPFQGKINVNKRHSGSHGNVMSATVTGPLNVLEQELHQKTGGRGHSTSASLNRTPGPTLVPGSIKILSRPGTSNGQAKKAESPKQASSPKPGRSPRRPKAEKKKQQAQPSPKPFQPQILKRPVEHTSDNTTKELQYSPPRPVAPTPMAILRREIEQTSPIATPVLPSRTTPTIERGHVEAPSPMSRRTSGTGEMVPVSAASPGPSHETAPVGFDRRTSQTNEQKASLLSLFGNKNAVATTSVPNVTSSPVQALPGSKIPSSSAGAQPVVSPVSALPPRNRMGSLASIGSGDSTISRQTQQTTSEKDKKFLLGFLNNLASDNAS